MTTYAHRLQRLMAVLALLAAFLGPGFVLPSPAKAGTTCSNYYHTHVWNPNVIKYHDVYMTTHEGDGEWTYWHEDYYNFGWVYQNKYLGTRYCS